MLDSVFCVELIEKYLESGLYNFLTVMDSVDTPRLEGARILAWASRFGRC